ncbi:unnamed protein product [Mesocestoides corti]|uniref:Uncharacterized protein n=1 Tax=Mesocestoides corti TaxID=53468 RepID=A0A0R3U3E5_MESCO|nr:unnamed protein product [Mesocestoides corti]
MFCGKLILCHHAPSGPTAVPSVWTLRRHRQILLDVIKSARSEMFGVFLRSKGAWARNLTTVSATPDPTPDLSCSSPPSDRGLVIGATGRQFKPDKGGTTTSGTISETCTTRLGRAVCTGWVHIACASTSAGFTRGEGRREDKGVRRPALPLSTPFSVSKCSTLMTGDHLVG